MKLLLLFAINSFAISLYTMDNVDNMYSMNSMNSMNSMDSIMINNTQHKSSTEWIIWWFTGICCIASIFIIISLYYKVNGYTYIDEF
jgi:hypothetical protein